jgi:5-formyltetrahydrofolate cyclo-ligase
MDGKASLRAQLLAARDRLAAREQVQAGAALALRALRKWQEVSVVLAYAGVGTEPPTRQLLDGLQERGVDVLLPVVAGTELHWAAYQGWEALADGPFGLLEPTGARVGPEPPAFDVWFVPALAVDSTGIRLGRGGGYYDRALARLEPPQRSAAVAVVYDEERVETLPRDAHDIPVGWALTPQTVSSLDAAAD